MRSVRDMTAETSSSLKAKPHRVRGGSLSATRGGVLEILRGVSSRRARGMLRWLGIGGGRRRDAVIGGLEEATGRRAARRLRIMRAGIDELAPFRGRESGFVFQFITCGRPPAERDAAAFGRARAAGVSARPRSRVLSAVGLKERARTRGQLPRRAAAVAIARALVTTAPRAADGPTGNSTSARR